MVVYRAYSSFAVEASMHSGQVKRSQGKHDGPLILKILTRVVIQFNMVEHLFNTPTPYLWPMGQ